MKGFRLELLRTAFDPSLPPHATSIQVTRNKVLVPSGSLPTKHNPTGATRTLSHEDIHMRLSLSLSLSCLPPACPRNTCPPHLVSPVSLTCLTRRSIHSLMRLWVSRSEDLALRDSRLFTRLQPVRWVCQRYVVVFPSVLLRRCHRLTVSLVRIELTAYVEVHVQPVVLG